MVLDGYTRLVQFAESFLNSWIVFISIGGDRYSNWLLVLKLNKDTSADLIMALRGYFATFEVP